MCWVICVVYKTLKLEVLILFANETVLYNVTIMFTTIAELEKNAYWRFYKTKRCSAYTLGKQIFEKYSLLYKAGQTMLLISVGSSHSQMFFKKSFLKISPISQKSTCAGLLVFVKLVTFLKTSFLTKHLRWLLLICLLFKSQSLKDSFNRVCYFSLLFVFYLKKLFDEP